jgi:hypothetical protein
MDNNKIAIDIVLLPEFKRTDLGSGAPSFLKKKCKAP